MGGGTRTAADGAPDDGSGGDGSNDGSSGGNPPPPRGGSPDDAAGEAVFTALYEELRVMARGWMATQKRGHSFQPTDLAHEAFLKLFRPNAEWKSRAHFLGTAARAMRHILVDHARGRNREKRGAGKARRIPLDEVVLEFEDGAFEIIALDDAVSELERFDPQAARIVVLKVFGGLTAEEIAEIMGLSTRTVERDWAAARAWLRKRLRPE